jgi:hypothetical protein
MPLGKYSITELERKMERIRRSPSSYRKQGRNKDGSRRMKAAPKRKLQALGLAIFNKGGGRRRRR